MPSRVFSPFLATLEETAISIDVVQTPDLGLAQRIVVSYTLQYDNETFIHMYEFCTDDFDEDRSAWAEFVALITCGETDDNSLIYHAMRCGGVMYEFTDLCLEDKQHAPVA